jgi:hypothetical protein
VYSAILRCSRKNKDKEYVIGTGATKEVILRNHIKEGYLHRLNRLDGGWRDFVPDIAAQKTGFSLVREFFKNFTACCAKRLWGSRMSRYGAQR